MAFAPDGVSANEEEDPRVLLLPNALPMPPVEYTLAEADEVPKAPPSATPLFGIDGALVGGLVGPPFGAEVEGLVDPSPFPCNFLYPLSP